MNRRIIIQMIKVKLLILLVASGCKAPETMAVPSVTAREHLADIKMRGDYTKENSAQLSALAQNLIAAIVRADREGILEQIDETKGAYVDIKAHKNKTEVAALLADKNSVIYRTFWDDDALQKDNPDSEIYSYRTYFSRARQIQLDFFFYNETECEIRLIWEKRPSSGILGNPIYHKINGAWRLVSLF